MKASVNFAFPLDLYKAIGSNNIGIVNQILARQPNLVNESETVCRGDTVLHCASRNGHLDMCLLFVNTYKIDCNAKNEDECTPLHCASLYGRLDIVKFLLNKGAAINTVNKWNQTPLLFATHCGHHQVVKFLLSKGADVNIRDIDGKSCLTEAKLRLHADTAKMIEEYGGNKQQSTSLDKNQEVKMKLDFSYANCNEDDKEIQVARKKLQYLQIKKQLKSNQQILEKINDDINDIVQIDAKIKCNKQLIEHALKEIEDANQTIAKASTIVAEAKGKILSLETQKSNLNAKRNELEEENKALKMQLQYAKEKSTETNLCTDCPICQETMLENTDIFQCPNGHYLCATCYKKINSCPHCRTSKHSFFRCRPVEDMLAKIYEQK